MPLKELFEYCSGSIAGKEHRRLWKNNQDALCLQIGEKAIVGIVCDGCGSQPHSEIGAQIGAQLVTQKLLDSLKKPFRLNRCLEETRQEIISSLRVMLSAGIIGQNMIEEALLFSIMGFAITPAFCMIFSIGDGVYILNGRINQIGPFEDNAPPYLGYELFEEVPFAPASLRFKIHAIIPTRKLQSLLVGSDGCQGFLENCECKIPGKDETMGTLQQFCADDRYYKGYLPNNRLKVANREHVSGDWVNQKLIIEQGLLSDDTTFIALRRKEGK